MPTIHFNGKTYNDLTEMPAIERQAYEQLMSIFKDEDQDGLPDVFQGDVVGNLIKAATTAVVVDGKQVSGLGEMTPEQRARLEKGMSKLKELGILSQVPDLSSSSQVPSWEDAEIRPPRPVIPSRSVIQEESGPRWLLVVAALAVAGICAAGVTLIIMRGGF